MYKGIKFPPLTKEEIEERYKEAQEEIEEVLKWKKEEEDKLAKDKFKTPQAKSANKRALFKVGRRINTVKGNLLYWDLRIKGKSHFYANIERHELWDELKKHSGNKKEE